MVYLNVIELNVETPKTHLQPKTLWNSTNFIFVTKVQFNSYQVPYSFFPLCSSFPSRFLFFLFTHLSLAPYPFASHGCESFPWPMSVEGNPFLCLSSNKMPHCIPSNELMKIGENPSFSLSSKDHSHSLSWSTSLKLDENAYD